MWSHDLVAVVTGNESSEGIPGILIGQHVPHCVKGSKWSVKETISINELTFHLLNKEYFSLSMQHNKINIFNCG